MYPNQLIFNAIFNKGQIYTGAKPDGDVYQKRAEIHIGYIAGDKREIRAGMTDNVLESNPYYLFNITDQDNIYMESVAILGVAHVSDAEYYAQRYFAETLGAMTKVVLVGAYTAQTLKRFLDSEISTITPRIKPEQVQRFVDVVVQGTVDWDGDYLLSHQGNIRLLLSDMIAQDDRQELLNPMSKEQFVNIIHDEKDAEQLDALFIDVVGLQRLANQLTLEMDKKATDKVKLDKITQSQKPFKRNGMTNLALHMSMSDGQTVVVLFYNPDETPSKLQPKDILVSWKWLLNNRDVTPALQPETGKDVSISVLAGRIMQLVDKNHARFMRNLAKQQAQDERLTELSEIISQKENILVNLEKQIADMQASVDRVLAGGGAVSEQQQNIIADSDPNISLEMTKNPNQDIPNAPDINLPVITMWDSVQADNNLQALIKEHDGKLTVACKVFIERHLMGKAFVTHIGHVMVNAKSKGKLVDRIRQIKALAVARIPEILLMGQVSEASELNKARNDSFTQFFTFEKILSFDGFTAKATLKVGKRQDGQNTAYYLGASKQKVQYDDLHSESTFPMLEQQGVKSTTELLDSKTQNIDNVNYFEVILDSLQVEVVTEMTPPEQNIPKNDNHDNYSQADIDFLNDVIAGKYDILADDFMVKMELVATKMYQTHPDLVSRAVDYYTAKTDEYATKTA